MKKPASPKPSGKTRVFRQVADILDKCPAFCEVQTSVDEAEKMAGTGFHVSVVREGKGVYAPPTAGDKLGIISAKEGR